MQIRLGYQLRGETATHELSLTPEEYFDPLNPGEVLSVRSVPRLLNTHEYTPHPPEQLAWTVVDIVDGANFWRVRTQLLNGMRSLMHHTQEDDGSEEIIHCTEIGPRCWHIVRTLKQAGKEWAVVMNTLTVEKPATFTADLDYHGGQSFERMKTFGDVR